MRHAPLVSVTVIVAFATLWSAPTVAADGGGGGSDTKTTQILQFETRKVSKDLTETLYESIKESVEASGEMQRVDRKQMTIQDMTVTAGCQEANAECLSGMRGLVDANRLIFGSIKRSGDAYLLTIRMFDFDEEAFIREIEDETVQGDAETVGKAIPAVVEGFFAGDVGKLEVAAPGAEGATIMFNGDDRGKVPASLDGLPLGQHAVTVQPETGEKRTKLVILRKGEPKTVTFDYGGSTSGSGGSQGNPPILGFSATGVGAAGLVVGIIGSVQNADAVEQADMLTCQNSDALCSEEFDNPNELVSEAKNRRDRVRNTAILSTVGYSVGALGLAVGGYFLYDHYLANPSPSALRLEGIGIQPKAEGAGLELSFEF